MYYRDQLTLSCSAWIQKSAELAGSLIHGIYSLCAVHEYRLHVGIKGDTVSG